MVEDMAGDVKLPDRYRKEDGDPKSPGVPWSMSGLANPCSRWASGIPVPTAARHPAQVHSESSPTRDTLENRDDSLFREPYETVWSDESSLDERILVAGIPVTIRIETFSIEVVIEGKMDEDMANALAEDIR